MGQVVLPIMREQKTCPLLFAGFVRVSLACPSKSAKCSPGSHRSLITLPIPMSGKPIQKTG